MENVRTIEEIVVLICKHLNEHEISYVIVGGIVIPFVGAPRTTVDVDLIIKLSSDNMARLIGFLRANDFHASEEDMMVAISGKSHYTVEDKLSPYRLDIKGIYDRFDQMTLERRVPLDYLGTMIYMASPEDIIIHKLRFGGESDMSDAKSIYIRQYGSLDMDYIITMCHQLGVYKDFLKMKKEVEQYM